MNNLKHFKLLVTGFICIFFTDFGLAQISGIITDKSNAPLPYVNIYIENTSIGTTTNLDGAYSLKVEPGKYTLVYQFIGYKTKKVSLEVSSEEIIQNVTLQDENYTMPEVVISANAEDPAYAIIRQAQAKRKFYKELIGNYECDAYVRGFNKILDAPEKILGVEVGDLDGALDSTRQGVVYLSESVSKLYSYNGKKKEIMYSSKISGDDQGYSFNSAKEMEFDFYSNNVDVNGKKLISPIASSAFTYYKFKLEGAQYDENGQLFNKIKVIPKSKFSPTFFGYIYINEDLWNIHSLDLNVTGQSMQFAFIDTLTFTQSFIPLKNNTWMPFSNVVQFSAGGFGFVIAGNFSCVYSNYELEDIDLSVFNREVFKVEEEANERNEMYWDSIRPIPLTVEERVDYVRKDSIRIVRESKTYLDSVDRETNKFKIGNILSGYTYRNSYKKERIEFNTPLTNFDINTIQGLNGSFGIEYSKVFNKNYTKRLRSSFTVNYGLSEKVLRPEFSLYYLSNRRNNLNFQLTGGRSLNQFNRLNPISERLNLLMTYLFRRNYLKAYDKKYVGLRIGRRLGPLFSGIVSLNYEDRSGVVNNYDKSLFYKDSREFTPNINIEDHVALIFRASLRIKIGEQLWTYPDRVYRTGSSWPTIWIYYKKGINALGSDVNYDLLHTTIGKTYALGLWGNFSFHAHGGIFLNEPDQFVDHMHFMGNQTHIGNPQNYTRRFLILPYYTHSTGKEFIQLHIQHHFKGALLGKLPLFKQLGWHLSGGFKYLNTGSQDPYREFHVGLDN
ncbi:MAG: DUF5686 and carboxypeptidase regulatory-like domain-containing protein, partial [Bacteroidia bacterium]|nr:DUF5686 and carboxypeptidase regulatory-like domain-containing protein [Bacteroidia bacterium]